MQQLCKFCRTCFEFYWHYCMFYFTCDRSFRVLQDEFEKREQLEELKESLEQLLQQEQVKSSELEERRVQQEKMLADEQDRLEKLEQERQMRDQQYEASFSR